MPGIDSIARLVGGMAVICYGTGLIVVNIYLMRFGVSDFNLLRTRFIFTGLLVVLMVTLATMLPLSAYHLCKEAWIGAISSDDAGRPARHPSLLLRLNSVLVGLLLALLPLMLNRFGLRQSWAAAAEEYVFAAVLGAFALVGRSARASRRGPSSGTDDPPGPAEERTARQSPWVVYVILGCFVFPYLALVVILFTANVYPTVPAQLGGGAEPAVQLVLTQDVVEGLQRSGLPMAAPGAGVTTTLDLLFRGEDFYVVADPTGQVFVILEDSVLAVKPHVRT
jgi:hypothetical protein